MNDGWAPIAGFPGYSVSRLGHVRNESSGRILQVRINQDGVPYVGLMKGVQQRNRSLPLLVASAFIPQPNAIYDTPINLDGDRTNCGVDNLMWRPRWYAIQYAKQFDEERYENPIEVPVRDVDSDEEYPNSLSAACHNGLLEREVVLSILNNTLTWPTYQKFVIAD